jgi:hypothetical protein
MMKLIHKNKQIYKIKAIAMKILNHKLEKRILNKIVIICKTYLVISNIFKNKWIHWYNLN